MCLATSNNLLLMLLGGSDGVVNSHRMPQNVFFPRNHDLLVSQKITQKTLFSHPPSPFLCNFCNCNSGGICTASQFQVQLPLLYTVWSNAYSEISPEVTLRPLATSFAKDHKGHSLMQTSFTEPPNRMPQNAFLPWTHDLLVSKTTTQRHFFSTLHPLSPVIFATATVVAFVLLRNSTSIVIHSMKQRLLRNQSGSDTVTSCDILRKRLQRALICANQLHWTAQ